MTTPSKFDPWRDVLGLELDPDRLEVDLAAFRDIHAELLKLRAVDLTDAHPAVIFEPTAPYRRQRP
jgi:hypothetical protein